MNKLSKSLLFSFSILIGILIFIYVGNIIGWTFILNSFKIFLNKEGLLIILLSFLNAFIGALRWSQILKGEGCLGKISLVNLFKIYIAGFSILYFFPMIVFGSEFFKVSLLKGNEKIDWDKSLASVFIERIIEWTVNLLVILVGTFYFFYVVAKPSENVLFIFTLFIFIVLVINILIYSYIFRKKSFIKRVLLKINKKKYEENLAIKTEKIVFDYFNVKNINLWKSYFLSIAKVLVMFLRIWVIIFFLGNIIDFMGGLSVLGFSFLSTLVPIPTALGVQELIQAFVFENLNINLGISSAFSMILRGGDVIVSVTGFVLFFKAGYDFLRNKFIQDEK